MQFRIIKIFIIGIFIGFSVFSFGQQKAIPGKEIKVYVFMSESCPICQSYTLTLKKLHEKYQTKQVVFIAVFPDYYSSSDSITDFIKKYDFAFAMPVLDKTGILAKELNATITPEVIVQNEKKEILYRGRIDDSFYALGKRRNVITSNDLDDALLAITAGKKVKNPTTKAVGCLISASK